MLLYDVRSISCCLTACDSRATGRYACLQGKLPHTAGLNSSACLSYGWQVRHCVCVLVFLCDVAHVSSFLIVQMYLCVCLCVW